MGFFLSLAFWLPDLPLSFRSGRWLCLVFLSFWGLLECENFGKSELWVELGFGWEIHFRWFLVIVTGTIVLLFLCVCVFVKESVKRKWVAFLALIHEGKVCAGSKLRMPHDLVLVILLIAQVSVCVFVSDPLFVLKQFVNMYMFLFRNVNLQVVEREGGTLILTVGIS